MNAEILQVQGLGKKYNVVNVLDNINMKMNIGEFVAVMGSSGSGKTTLLNCISSMEQFEEGKVVINGMDIGKLSEKELSQLRRREIGMIFQDYNLLETLTIRENISLQLTMSKAKSNLKKIEDIADYFHLKDVLDKFPEEVSGGERQRCTCARTLINVPRLILADEPTGALDRESAKSLLRLLHKMNKEFNTSVLMVTHDPFSASYTDRVLYIQDGKITIEIEKKSQSQGEYLQNILKKIYPDEEKF